MVQIRVSVEERIPLRLSVRSPSPSAVVCPGMSVKRELKVHIKSCEDGDGHDLHYTKENRIVEITFRLFLIRVDQPPTR